MKRSSYIIVAATGLVLMLGGASIWGGVPLNNDVSDADGNTAGGTSALSSNTTGSNNTAVGSGTLQSNADGIANTALGVQALLFNTSGAYNTALGFQTLTHLPGSPTPPVATGRSITTPATLTPPAD